MLKLLKFRGFFFISSLFDMSPIFSWPLLDESLLKTSLIEVVPGFKSIGHSPCTVCEVLFTVLQTG